MGYQELFLVPLRGAIAWDEYFRVCLFALSLSNFLFAVLSCSLSLVMDMEHEIPKILGVLATHGDGEPPKTLDAHYVKDTTLIILRKPH